MQLAMIGLGKMGANMVRRLAAGGHQVAAYDVSAQRAQALQDELPSVSAMGNLEQVIGALPSPRVIWLMVPHQYVDSTLDDLLKAGVTAGDVLVDGGNSNYPLSQQRSQRLQAVGVHYVDCGTSGGVWGLENGYSLMVGGTPAAVETIRPLLETLAPAVDAGWGHVGPSGAGHFVKMVHNGIEYGMMQSFAEGLELLHDKPGMALNTGQITRIWQHGSVVRSWLLDLIADALAQDKDLSTLSDYVDDSGEGRWTVDESVARAIPAPVLTLALQMRFRSRQENTYAGKILNAMRAGFGGHPIKPADAD